VCKSNYLTIKKEVANSNVNTNLFIFDIIVNFHKYICFTHTNYLFILLQASDVCMHDHLQGKKNLDIFKITKALFVID
jgi:hypothetical protein